MNSLTSFFSGPSNPALTYNAYGQIANTVYKAIDTKDTKTLEQFLDCNKNFDVTAQMGGSIDSPLARAVTKNSSELVELCLTKGHIGNKKEVKRLFEVAIAHTQYDAAMSFITTKKIDFSAMNPEAAEEYAHLILDALLTVYCQKENRSIRNTFLMKPALEFIECILKEVPKVLQHHSFPDGRTLMHKVAFYGDTEMMTYLEKRGGRTDLKSKGINDNVKEVTAWELYMGLHNNQMPLTDYSNISSGTSSGLFDMLDRDTGGLLLEHLNGPAKAALAKTSKFANSMVTGELYGKQQPKASISIQKPAKPQPSRLELFFKTLGEAIHTIYRIDMD